MNKLAFCRCLTYSVHYLPKKDFQVPDSDYVVCVHLAGFPDEEIYSRLILSMKKLGFDRLVMGKIDTGALLEVVLPPATFVGQSGLPSDQLACDLSSHLQKSVWNETCVFTAKFTEWALI